MYPNLYPNRNGDAMNAQTTTAATAAADQLAAELRDRRSDHAGHRCDALDPCEDCRVKRVVVQTVRALAAVPTQRQGD